MQYRSIYDDGFLYFVEQKFYKNRIEVNLLTRNIAHRKGYYKKLYKPCDKYELYVDAFRNKDRAKRFYDRVCEMNKSNFKIHG